MPGPGGTRQRWAGTSGASPEIVSGSIHGADLFAEHPEAVRAVVAFLAERAPAHT